MTRYWTELNRGPEGVSVAMYRRSPDEHSGPVVVDEAWWTWPEFLELNRDPAIGINENLRTTLEGDE